MASMLGDKLGVEVVIGDMKTASTDGKIIMLPALPLCAEEELAALDIAGINMEQFGFEDLDLMGGAAQPIENTSREYGEEDFGDDKFECECPRCGFKFNK